MARGLMVAICLGWAALAGFAMAQEGGEPEPHAKWIAYGRVTDGQGNGVTSATVDVSCGMNSLMPGGSATTDSDGRYRLLFGPGIIYTTRAEPWGEAEMRRTPLQVAVFSAGKPGFYEQNLSRQGNRWMAGTLDKVQADDPRRDTVFLPGEPQGLDFVLLPAARLRGRVVDPEGNPMAGMKMYIDGEEMGPGASVLKMITTDANGEFEAGEIPCKAYWFDPWERPKYDNIRSETIEFARPGPYELELILDAEKKTLTARVISAP